MRDTCEAPREIDMATAPAFLAVMCEMVDCVGNRAVVIDCSAITFMDSSALHALMDAHEYAIEHDHVLVIRGLAEHCLRIARICDHGNVLTIEPRRAWTRTPIWAGRCS
jgi:anti-anti-sigma factor